ncbi:MAG: FAD-dependent monooxygenase, partial [Thermoleophilaceae bacterium]|nr:FAD-dependent monooxygenase [Thermoleophilaceae bacterium]
VESVASGNAFAVMNGEGGSAAVFLHRGDGFLLAVVNRLDHWQVAYIYAEGSYQTLKEAGIEAFRRSIAEREPRLLPHLESLTDWRQLAPLSVAFSRCRRWYKPGLLLIGDAAHVMTPAAGAGIKYAIEDAVETANVLGAALRSGRIRTSDLARVQRRRECPTRFMQGAAGLQQQTILSRALRRGAPPRGRARLPLLARLLIRLPVIRDLPARFIGFGFWRVRIEDTSEISPPPRIS